MTERIRCPHCTKTMPDANAVYQHVRAKHGRQAARELPREEREQSMAELLVEAEIERAMGVPFTNPWVAEMFDL